MILPRALLGPAVALLLPATAAACAVCTDAASGDRGFNHAFIAFMATPFAVAAVAGLVLARLGRAARTRKGAGRAEEGKRC